MKKQSINMMMMKPKKMKKEKKGKAKINAVSCQMAHVMKKVRGSLMGKKKKMSGRLCIQGGDASGSQGPPGQVGSTNAEAHIQQT